MSSSSRKNDRLGEFALIVELFAPLSTSRNALGLKDDAAILPQSRGKDIVVTTDTVVAGVHFLDTDPPDTVARKALRVNLSDLAAKGAKPAGYLLTLSLHSSVDMKWLRSFVDGLADDQHRFGVDLLGGDTTATPGPTTITIMAFGYVPKGTMILRSKARVGDLVFVTGTIGDGAGGLQIAKGEGKTLSRAARDHLLRRFRVPQPRTTIGPLLRGIANAALDVSDGLIADIGHIAETSRVRIAIEAQSVPRSAALHALWGDGPDALKRAFTGGDDYEIAFTAPARLERKVMRVSARTGVPVSKIGWVDSGRGLNLRGPAGQPIEIGAGGWTHF
jgi:thiamine-monophosphate kinase